MQKQLILESFTSPLQVSALGSAKAWKATACSSLGNLSLMSAAGLGSRRLFLVACSFLLVGTVVCNVPFGIQTHFKVVTKLPTSAQATASSQQTGKSALRLVCCVMVDHL
eukprot:scaffold247099_cov17-Tisochrysis_lutea.AAC.1